MSNEKTASTTKRPLTDDIREEILDSDRLRRLEVGGVDNWTWYDESLGGEDRPTDTAGILNALDNGGVDNWEGYDFALEGYFEYADYLHDVPNGSEDYLFSHEWEQRADEPEPEVAPEPDPEPEVVRDEHLLAAARRWAEATGSTVSPEALHDAAQEAHIWSMSTFTSDFRAAIKKAQKDGTQAGPFMDRARGFYIEAIERKGLLATFLAGIQRDLA